MVLLVQKGEELFRQAEQWIRQQPVENLYVALAAVILTFLLFVLLSCSKRTKSDTIILAGLSGSGKTTLFCQDLSLGKTIGSAKECEGLYYYEECKLRDGSSHQGTVTSMEPNSDTFILHSKADKKGKLRPVRVVDVPRHSRLRPKIDDYLPQAAGLVFVVDAIDYLPNYRAAADKCGGEDVPHDKVTAHSKEFIRKQLEKELDKLRTSRTAISTADINDEYTLGVPGEAFAFSQVVAAESSGLTGEVSQVEKFIRKQVKVLGDQDSL